jgi:hypothetical protein
MVVLEKSVRAGVDLVDLLLLDRESREFVVIVIIVVDRLAGVLALLGRRALSSSLRRTALAGLRGLRGTSSLLGSIHDARRSGSLGFKLALDFAHGDGGAALSVLLRVSKEWGQVQTFCIPR